MIGRTIVIAMAALAGGCAAAVHEPVRITPAQRPYLHYLAALDDVLANAMHACDVIADPTSNDNEVGVARRWLRGVERQIDDLPDPGPEFAVVDVDRQRQVVLELQTDRLLAIQHRVGELASRANEAGLTIMSVLSRRQDRQSSRVLAAAAAAEMRQMRETVAERRRGAVLVLGRTGRGKGLGSGRHLGPGRQ